MRPRYTAAEILQMHLEDLAEGERIVAELAVPVVMRSHYAQLAATQIAAAQASVLVVPLSIASIPQCESVPASPLLVAVPCRVQHLDSLLDRTMT